MKRISVVGGGPAGLYFALLARGLEPRPEVTVWERSPRDAEVGWGVVLSGQTLSRLARADGPSHREILARSLLWENVDIVHRGTTVSVGGNSFSGTPRASLLRALRRRCEELGVTLRFGQPAPPLAELQRDDLVVAADGRASPLRAALALHFRPHLDRRDNRYIWLATPRLFAGLTLIFRPTPHGTFAAHAYQYCADRSTFIVECSGETFQRAGLRGLAPDQTLAALQRIFAEELRGEPLIGGGVPWDRFVVVQNRRWSHENVVLLGDALHTAHFSIGSGTKLAMETAVALRESLADYPDLGEALTAFEATRRPEVELIQAVARKSMRWFEQVDGLMDLAPLPLAHSCMTRSGRLSDAELRRRAPAFMAAYEAHRAAEAASTPGR